MRPFILLSFLALSLSWHSALASPTPALIVNPTNGSDILPHETFSFDYLSMSEQNSEISSYTCTCWYFTGPVQGFQATSNFATGSFIGRFRLGNYSDSTSLPPIPKNLTMPDFSILPGGGAGERVSNYSVSLGCIEEYGYEAQPSVGPIMSFAYVPIVYNGTKGN